MGSVAVSASDVADTIFSTGECRKTGKILASFVDPRQAFGPDKIIPPNVLANAKVKSSTSFACAMRSAWPLGLHNPSY